MDHYLKLAKDTVEIFIKTNQIPPLPKDLPSEILEKKAGAFVSIHQKSGELRGCIGTFLPTKPNLALEIITNAISSATQDPRFPPLTEEELDNLTYSVDILSSPKPATKKQINPKKYGLIVTAEDGRKGLLLPDLPGVETSEQQIAICRQKAGIGPQEKVEFQIFTVARHGEIK
ncbi:MAG: AmmeMemoRadiSam system protein A [Candidatus Marinimicrobia bacterium]|nr:AmmeMemoRadiSam system protein A [Candidatus Neomarinimicrobiota bacterium]